MHFKDLVEGDVFWYYVDDVGASSEFPTQYICRGLALITPHKNNERMPISHFPGLTDYKNISLIPGKNDSYVPYLMNLADHFFDSPSKVPQKIDYKDYLYGKSGVQLNRLVACYDFNILKSSYQNPIKNIKDGMNCSWCTNWYEMAISNQSDGTLKCWSCRNSNAIKRMLK